MRTVHRLVTRQGRQQPFVMILEDMQWVDSETQAAMDALVEALPPYTLVASTYRPEYVDRWSRHPGYTQVRVDALEPPATGDMLDALLGDESGLTPLKRLVAERANGNPLFLEECVTTLVETGALAGERGAYRLTRPVLALEVPATVRATIASRIDRLRYEDKRLLQAASVIGDAVPVRLLETVADVPSDEVRRGLDQLHAAGLLDQRALFPDLEYGFRHALVHDVAYESLLHERRRTLHARILEAIERSYEGGRLAEQTERLAHHAFLGEAWERAVGYCREAGGRTLARMASWESVSFFERALAALAHRPGRRGGARHRRGPPLRSAQRAGAAGPARAQRRGAARGRRARRTPRRPAAAGPRALVREQRALGARRGRRGGARGRARARHRRGDGGPRPAGRRHLQRRSRPPGPRRLPPGPHRAAAQPGAPAAPRERRDLRPARHRGGADARAPGVDPGRAGPVRRGDGGRTGRSCGSRKRGATPTASRTRCSGWAAPCCGAARCGRRRACSSAASGLPPRCPRSSRPSRATSPSSTRSRGAARRRSTWPSGRCARRRACGAWAGSR